jgi:hypothetical protein
VVHGCSLPNVVPLVLLPFKNKDDR